MKIVVQNKFSQIIFGGKDNLVNYEFKKNIFEFLSCYIKDYENTTKYRTFDISCNECGTEYESEISNSCLFCKSKNINAVRQWDGKIYYIDRRFKFNTGFLPLVYNLLNPHYCIDIEDCRINSFTPKPLVKNIGPWELRDNQIPPVESILNRDVGGIYFPRGILDCATNAGKNSMIASHIKSIEGRILILIHRSFLFRDLYKFLTSCGIDCGRIGEKHFEIKDVTIGLYKTVLNKSKLINVKQYLSSLNGLVVDECHTSGGKEYQKLLKKINAFSTLFVSGTPLDYEDPARCFNIIGQSSDITHKISNLDLISEGFSQKPTIYMLDYDGNEFLDYKDQLIESQYNPNKISQIQQICALGKQTLIVTEFVDHGSKLLEELLDLDIFVEFMSGTDKEKHNKLKRFEDQKINTLISTLIVDVGISIDSIQVLIILFGGKSMTRLKQVIGRILRHDGLSDTCTIFDFMDKGKNLSKHTKARIALYKEEGFEISLDNKI